MIGHKKIQNSSIKNKGFLKLTPEERLHVMDNLLREHIKIRALNTGKTENEIYQEYFKISSTRNR